MKEAFKQTVHERSKLESIKLLQHKDEIPSKWKHSHWSMKTHRSNLCLLRFLLNQKHSLFGSWASATSLSLTGRISRQTLYTASQPGYHQKLMHCMGVVKNELRNKA